MSRKAAQLSFGICGMAAALNITVDQLRIGYQRGEIVKPDRARPNEPRWSVVALACELKKRTPKNYSRVLFALEALLRIERAEGLTQPAPDLSIPTIVRPGARTKAT